MRTVLRRLGAVFAVTSGIAASVVGVGAGQAQAACDDARLVSIEGYRAAEGTAVQKGQLTPFIFTVTSSACPQEGSVQFETVAYTADRTDFVSQAGAVSFKPGDPSKQVIVVQVVPDSKPERNECFSVRLSKPAGRIVIPEGRGEAAGIIVDDDTPANKTPIGGGFICSE
ncbi:MAG: endoglucanase [Mycobacteriales bacterium]